MYERESIMMKQNLKLNLDEDKNIRESRESNNDNNPNESFKESKTFQVGNSIKVAGETGTYVAGGSAVTTGFFRASSAIIETTTTAGEIFGATALKLIGSGCLIAGAVIGVGPPLLC